MFSLLVLLVAVAWAAARTVVASFVDDIVNAFTGGAEAIYDWVKGVVRAAVNAAVSWLSTVIGWTADVLNLAISAVWQLAAWSYNTLTQVISFWVSVLSGLIDAARQFAEYVAGIALDFARQVFSWAWNAIADVLARIAQSTLDVLTWVWNNVLQPLREAIDNVVKWVQQAVITWVLGVLNNVWCFIKDLLSQIGHISSVVTNDILGPFKVVLDAGLKALRWLVFMATHPFDWFFKLFQDFFGRGGPWLFDALSKSAQSSWDQVDNWLTKFFE